eukprot:6462480-Amphidinium_carterae.2
MIHVQGNPPVQNMCDAFSRLKWFLRAQTEDENGRKKTMYGDTAKRHLVNTLLAEKYELKSLAEINPLQSFAYLLDEQEQALVRRKTDEFLAKRQGTTGTSS